MKAVIMAAGEGGRLEPLTDVRPKPMLPIANKPLLEYVIQAVVHSEVDEIILITGYQRERIQNHFGTGEEWGVPSITRSKRSSSEQGMLSSKRSRSSMARSWCSMEIESSNPESSSSFYG